jgi:Protein of unknown function (DUF3551)
MRRLLTASALLMVFNVTPGEARPYPYCARTRATGGNPDCMYVTLQQCMAYINGLGGDCIQNPAVLFGQGPGLRNGPPQDLGWQGNSGWQNDGSNNGRRKKSP